MFPTERPSLLSAPVEFALSVLPELTKATQPLLVRLFGTVMRCERVPDGDELYGVAVRNSGHCYLSPAETAGFQAGASKPPDL
jgi:hypothetical protein